MWKVLPAAGVHREELEFQAGHRAPERLPQRTEGFPLYFYLEKAEHQEFVGVLRWTSDKATCRQDLGVNI